MFNPGKVLPDDPPEPTLVEPVEAAGDVVAPASAEETAGVLRALSEAGRPVRVGGAGAGGDTRDDDGDGVEVRLSTSELRGVTTFAPQDLYLTAGAGTPVDDVAAFLEPHGLIAPIRSPFAGASLGGLVASNLNAPWRMRYGGLRDLTLCATVALADGRVLRAGRPLVKNVAGYDLAKVFVGSFGTLGVLVDVTLKLAAAPRERRTLALTALDLAAGVELAAMASKLALVASAVVLLEDDGGWRLLVTAEGMPEDVDAELAEVERAWRGAGGRRPGALDAVEVGGTGSDAWAEFLGAAGDGALTVRAGVATKDLAAYLKSLPERPGRRLLVDYASGLVYATGQPADAGDAGVWLDELRRPALEREGYALVLNAPPELAAGLDRWGYEPQALDVMRRMKQRWDPAGILEPGTFVFA